MDMGALRVVSGGVVKFVYLITGIEPAEPADENTIYFSPEGESIFVGDVKIVDGKSLRDDLSVVHSVLEDLEVDVSGISESVEELEGTVSHLETEVENAVESVFELTDSIIPNIESRIEVVEESITWVVV